METMTATLAPPVFIGDDTNIGYYRNHLPNLLDEAGMSLREVARYTGLSTTTLSSLSSKKEEAPARIDTTTVLRLAYFLTHRLGRIVRPDDIFEYIPPPDLNP